ncbi:hypothetical protein F383_17880 [Gossypium arboreum]|uniref:Uncharacterized protein n=1 Tax=Gossypium arboreum TaxID=29729 RepID=A0A0B0MM16_GOSAR|nr:hypothetical protein F383_17880 [Gossypium arboreum]
MTYGYVTRRVSPSVEININSVCSTWPHTRACDLAVWHQSVYPTSLALPSTRACRVIFRPQGQSYTGSKMGWDTTMCSHFECPLSL